MQPLRYVALCAALIATSANAAEGMWTFDHIPFDKIRAETGAAIDQAWADHVQKAAVRLSVGCSASIVSPDGLVATNHHCVEECEDDLSTADHDYDANGFVARRREDEVRCPDLDAEILVEIRDITAQINAATAGRSAADFTAARDRALTAAENACGDDAKYRCQALSFYGGARYKLHRYRRYTDVRLVFGPEFDIAAFGGDPDNFNFPRYDLDVGFLRLYDGGKAAKTPDYLTWATDAPAPGDAMFVAGNPGSTERAMTMAQLSTYRDMALATNLIQNSEYRGRLIQYGKAGGEAKRLSDNDLIWVENTFKSQYGQHLALTDASFLAAKQAQEDDLKARVAADPALAARIGDPWAEIARAQDAYRNHFLHYRQLEGSAGGPSELFDEARMIVRGARQRALPESQRLPEYSASRIERTARRVATQTPIDPGLEQLGLEFWLLKTREYLTVDDPAVKTILGKESPESLAARLVSGTRLFDAAERKRLWDGGLDAVNASDDPMIVFLRKIDDLGLDQQKIWQAEVSAPVTQAQARIAEARFAVYGESLYPDANFTLRLSYGQVQGWTREGVTVGPFTTWGGLYSRVTGEDPFALPENWLAAKGRLNPDTVLNFVSTNDIIGGNSGSPVIDARGRIVGLAFDGNIFSLGGDFGYDPVANRCVNVSTAAITEALSKVYGLDGLVAELTGARA